MFSVPASTRLEVPIPRIGDWDTSTGDLVSQVSVSEINIAVIINS